MYNGLWYPIIIALMTFVVGVLLVAALLIVPALAGRRVIPNGVDLSVFRPQDRGAARAAAHRAESSSPTATGTPVTVAGAGATAFGQLMLAYRVWIARIGVTSGTHVVPDPIRACEMPSAPAIIPCIE